MEKFLFGKIKNWQQTSKKIAAFFLFVDKKNLILFLDFLLKNAKTNLPHKRLFAALYYQPQHNSLFFDHVIYFFLFLEKI